ncbi:hypothetical protein FQN57_003118 [Myotisia sp. PD_48]|nr:hypothetical protein FQN57_003118 [Myotisia sp. PD_48]
MDSSTGSAADKKRNKLGYHRTSVACAPDDSQGRCENCIRLKKECHFFPVDQQPTTDKRSRPGSKTETATPDASLATTPPVLGGATMVDQEDAYFQYQAMPLNSAQDLASFNPSAGAFAGAPVASFTSDPMPVVEMGVGPPPLNQWSDPSIFDHQVPGMVTGPQIVPPNEAVMHQVGVPLSVPLASATSLSIAPDPADIVSVNMPSGAVYGTPQESAVWSGQITRSMSLSRPGVSSPISQQYADQFHSSQQLGQEFKRRMTSPAETYQIAMDPSIPQAMGSTIPVSFGGVPTPISFATYNLTGASAEPQPTLNEVMTSTPDQSLPMGVWYSGEPMQYPPQLKHEVTLVTAPGHPAYNPHHPHHPG